MTFMRKFMDMLRINKDDCYLRENDYPKIERSAKEVYEDFKYIPFISHCSAAWTGCTSEIIHSNLTEQNIILSYIDSLNDSLHEIGDTIDLKDIHIYTESVKFEEANGNIFNQKTFLKFSPYTKTGKKSKFPLSITFSTQEDFTGDNITYTFCQYLDNNEYEHGVLYFMIDGSIGKAEIYIFMKGRTIYEIKYRLFGSSLVIYSIRRNCILKDNTWKLLYKI